MENVKDFTTDSRTRGTTLSSKTILLYFQLLARLQSSDLVLQQASPPTQAMTCLCALWRRLRPPWQQLHSSAAFTPMKTAVTEPEDNSRNANDFKALCSQSIKISNWDLRPFHCCYYFVTLVSTGVQYFCCCWWKVTLPFYSLLHPPSPPVACTIGSWQAQLTLSSKEAIVQHQRLPLRMCLIPFTNSSWSVELVFCHSEVIALWVRDEHLGLTQQGATCSCMEASGKWRSVKSSRYEELHCLEYQQGLECWSADTVWALGLARAGKKTEAKERIISRLESRISCFIH